MKTKKRENKSRKLSAKVSASSSKIQKSEKMVSEKKDIALVTIDSADDEEQKVEQKVVHCKGEEKYQKYSNEVIDDDELFEDKVLEMFRKLGRLQTVGDLYHNHVSYEKDVIEMEFVKHLVQNNLVATDIADFLPEELVEILINRKNG